jgi:hypothetical protein
MQSCQVSENSFFFSMILLYFDGWNHKIFYNSKPHLNQLMGLKRNQIVFRGCLITISNHLRGSRDWWQWCRGRFFHNYTIKAVFVHLPINFALQETLVYVCSDTILEGGVPSPYSECSPAYVCISMHVCTYVTYVYGEACHIHYLLRGPLVCSDHGRLVHLQPVCRVYVCLVR